MDVVCRSRGASRRRCVTHHIPHDFEEPRTVRPDESAAGGSGYPSLRGVLSAPRLATAKGMT